MLSSTIRELETSELICSKVLAFGWEARECVKITKACLKNGKRISSDSMQSCESSRTFTSSFVREVNKIRHRVSGVGEKFICWDHAVLEA